MAKVRGRNTGPEMIVRRLLHRLGYRYRLHVQGLPGSPDIVLPARRKIVFVHGCFWHSHPGCNRASRPNSNAEFWSKKLEANRERDLRQLDALRELGWEVLVIWQCELRDKAALELVLTGFLGSAVI